MLGEGSCNGSEDLSSVCTGIFPLCISPLFFYHFSFWINCSLKVRRHQDSMGFFNATFNCQTRCQSQVLWLFQGKTVVPRRVPGVTAVTLQTLSAQRLMEKPKQENDISANCYLWMLFVPLEGKSWKIEEVVKWRSSREQL